MQFTHEIKNNGPLPFLDTIVSRTDENFSTSVYCKTVFLPHAHSCHIPKQKMATFYTFVNSTIDICSDPISFNNGIQFLKEIAFGRDYNPSIVHKALFKLQNPLLSHPSHSNSNINIIIPYFPKTRFSVAKNF